ncbi:hypothetical protein PQX77_011590 [Marasmius sp. AFHP31]|nr:hypothetical protein PQX77_018850 [Marasmius sp. AFHP31]KAK1219610.1 hypothetical protein PQX77_017657 [Marasmius sp. AFHP31]KAK1225477.1 hypothetical protein PQX77_011590 [Marasmius sp. AFHP31]
MNIQQPWLNCLRLQGRAETQWLSLHGYPPEEIPNLVESRWKFRKETIQRYHRMISEKVAFRELMEKRVRQYERKLANPNPRARLKSDRATPEAIEQWIQMKASFQAQFEDADAGYCQLQEMVHRLSPPKLILTRRVKVHATPEVEAHVKNMISML